MTSTKCKPLQSDAVDAAPTSAPGPGQTEVELQSPHCRHGRGCAGRQKKAPGRSVGSGEELACGWVTVEPD